MKHTVKSKREKCVHCGNNPTNHLFAYLTQSMMIPLTPLFHGLSYLHHRYLDNALRFILTPYIWAFRKTRLWGVNMDPNKAHTERSKVIWQEAEKRGIKMEQFTIFGKPIEQYRAKLRGHWHYFESIPIPPEYRPVSYAWMDDKWMLKKFLRERNIPVAFGRSVASQKQARRTFSEGEAPWIAKPRLGSRGRHTVTHIYNEGELVDAFKIAQELSLFVVVEEQLFGSVYRGTSIGGKIVGILRGDPPRIVGDGIHTIEKLIQIKNKTKHPKVKDVAVSSLLLSFIGRQNLDLKTILQRDKMIDLSERIGINCGGYSAEELPKTHPKILEYLKRAGDALKAPVIGFDFIIPDITKNPDEQRWGIIEANSLPFVNLHHFPLEGTPINAAAKVWDLWEK